MTAQIAKTASTAATVKTAKTAKFFVLTASTAKPVNTAKIVIIAVAVLTATIATTASIVKDYPGKRTIATTNLWRKKMNKNYCADLRVDSMYASISDLYQKFLCPILNGFGKPGLFLIHAWIVTLDVSNIFIRSFIFSILSISSIVKNPTQINVSIFKKE
jgi:hypothetical protein